MTFGLDSQDWELVAGMVVGAENSATEFFQDKHVVDFSGPTPGRDDGQIEFGTSCQWRRSPVLLPLRRLMILLGDCGRQQAQMEGFRERHQSSNLFPLRCAFPDGASAQGDPNVGGTTGSGRGHDLFAKLLHLAKWSRHTLP